MRPRRLQSSRSKFLFIAVRCKERFVSVLHRLKDRISANWVAFSILELMMLALLIGILYSPIMTANFQGDDYGFLRYLFFNYSALLQGRGLAEWLVSFPWLS